MSSPTLEYGHGVTAFSEVHRLDLGTWRSRKVFDGKRVIKSLDLSADGTHRRPGNDPGQRDRPPRRVVAGRGPGHRHR